MFDRSLHTGNVAVAFATVASAAADPLTLGVAGALISGALSGTELFKNANRAQKSLAKEMTDVMQASIAEADMPEDRRKHVTQMLSIFPPGIEDLARGSMVASTIANNMRAFVAANARDGVHKGDDELDAYAQVMRETLAPFLTPDTLIEGMLAELLARSEKSGDADRMRDEGITEKAIIRLAQRIAGETDDLGRAWLELQNAMDIAVRVQQEGRVPSNHGDFVDEVLKRVTALSAEGEYTQAGDEIAEALAKVEAEKARLLRSGIEMAMLAGDSARTAALLVQQAEAEGSIGYQELRALHKPFYERGRDEGLALDLNIAIDLARIILSRSRDSGTRCAAWNILGLSLQVSGAHQVDPSGLERAVDAFREALGFAADGCSREELAMTQNNLGIALGQLGGREDSGALMAQAVSAFKDGLKTCSQERSPARWALLQTNLGAALQELGMRQNSAATLRAAVDAFEKALQERHPTRNPIDWAATQSNLGIAYIELAKHAQDQTYLTLALQAFESALRERRREKQPLAWAETQDNRGSALRLLGMLQGDPGQLELAQMAHEDALLEFSQDRVPMSWAKTQGNLANVHLAFFDVTDEAEHLDQALNHSQAAREVFAQAGANQYLAITDANIAKIEARRAG
ncbi:hypothetical protein ATO10_09228 [Actibacterium atlanticum]|uniref:Uncharacterized protein n=1 Tax=Actibacterium atlanticum TaxID=1461693 RepID=A0A058ZLE3_9RHOB|nr:tetratricopeptide repeat protein [Actibacterium atlanticum]KCV82017.1 hypothetical protein ATO10_09228 [Actibacterium atlanticum]